MCQSRLKLSCEVHECKPLVCGIFYFLSAQAIINLACVHKDVRQMVGRGLHSSTFQLNVSASCGTWGV